ncbi:hypothetical protein GCM10009839_01160 [Catenulispora yoronensis]|uniref:Uncharacterized protein n=1 Tax=Catenulispora yoronensis TaxID=450799 RepID=A0ABN2TIR1_9ACTN
MEQAERQRGLQILLGIRGPGQGRGLLRGRAGQHPGHVLGVSESLQATPECEKCGVTSIHILRSLSPAELFRESIAAHDDLLLSLSRIKTADSRYRR